MTARQFLRRVFRVVIHVPVGAINASFFFIGAPAALGVCFFIGFILYEFNEDRWIHDKAYCDILGWLAGFAVFSLFAAFSARVAQFFKVL